jgi:hypothetical protein
MNNKLKLYYLISSILSIFFICIAILNIKSTIDDFTFLNNDAKDEEVSKCLPYFIWKFSFYSNVFFFFACLGFLGYLIFKRNANYTKVIFIRIGPTIDTIIIIFLILISFLFGPLLSVEIIMMLIYYMEILFECSYFFNDLTKKIFIPYVVLGVVISVVMNILMTILCSRRCSRRRLISRRNISNIGEIVNII